MIAYALVQLSLWCCSATKLCNATQVSLAPLLGRRCPADRARLAAWYHALDSNMACKLCQKCRAVCPPFGMFRYQPGPSGVDLEVAVKWLCKRMSTLAWLLSLTIHSMLSNVMSVSVKVLNYDAIGLHSLHHALILAWLCKQVSLPCGL